MSLASELAEVIDRTHQALAAFMKGDPAPVLQLFSHRDDVTLGNPFDPPASGWDGGSRDGGASCFSLS